MAITAIEIETGRPSGIILPRAGEIPSSPLIEIPEPFIEAIPAERLCYIAEGKGIDLRYEPTERNPYKEYEIIIFHAKAEEALQTFRRDGEDSIIFGPLLNDYIFREKDFMSVHRHDLTKFRIVGNKMILDTLIEGKTPERYREDARQVLKEKYGQREKYGFPMLVRVISAGNFLERRIKYALSGAMSIPREIFSPTFIGEEGVHVLFISPTSQEGRTMFLRPGVSHQQVDLPPELKVDLAEFEAKQKAIAEQRKREKEGQKGA